MVCLPPYLPKAQIVAYHCLKIKKSNAKRSNQRTKKCTNEKVYYSNNICNTPVTF